MSVRLEVKSLNSEKVLFDNVQLGNATVEDIIRLVETIEEPGSQWRLMAVVNDRLVPLRWTEKRRKLVDLGMQDEGKYRVEVCLAWAELKKVLM